MANEHMTVGQLRAMLAEYDPMLPIDFGCQCDSFDEMEAGLLPAETCLGIYLVGAKAEDKSAES